MERIFTLLPQGPRLGWDCYDLLLLSVVLICPRLSLKKHSLFVSWPILFYKESASGRSGSSFFRFRPKGQKRRLQKFTFPTWYLRRGWSSILAQISWTVFCFLYRLNGHFALNDALNFFFDLFHIFDRVKLQLTCCPNFREYYIRDHFILLTCEQSEMKKSSLFVLMDSCWLYIFSMGFLPFRRLKQTITILVGQTPSPTNRPISFSRVDNVSNFDSFKNPPFHEIE